MSLSHMILGMGMVTAMGTGVHSHSNQVSIKQLALEHPAMNQNLQQGSQSHWVSTLQDNLKLLGYQVGPTTGTFNQSTVKQLKEFQERHHLAQTGVTNMVTWQDILAGFHITPLYTATTTSQTTVSSKAAVTSSVSHTSSTVMKRVPRTAKTIAGRPVLKEFKMTATAYGPSYRANGAYGAVDAFGQPLRAGMIAVDPSVIPLKSTVYVTGYHDAYLPSSGFVGKALDTGGAIQGHRIDIFMNHSHPIVSNFGVQPVTVYVLGK